MAFALTLKATDRRLYDELVASLADAEMYWTKRAIGGTPDNSLFVANGFARGVAEIHRVVRDASILSPQPTPGSR